MKWTFDRRRINTYEKFLDHSQKFADENDISSMDMIGYLSTSLAVSLVDTCVEESDQSFCDNFKENLEKLRKLDRKP